MNTVVSDELQYTEIKAARTGTDIGRTWVVGRPLFWCAVASN